MPSQGGIHISESVFALSSIEIWKILDRDNDKGTPLGFDIVACRVLRPASYRRVWSIGRILSVTGLPEPQCCGCEAAPHFCYIVEDKEPSLHYLIIMSAINEMMDRIDSILANEGLTKGRKAITVILSNLKKTFPDRQKEIYEKLENLRLKHGISSWSEDIMREFMEGLKEN